MIKRRVKTGDMTICVNLFMNNPNSPKDSKKKERTVVFCSIDNAYTVTVTGGEKTHTTTTDFELKALR